MNKQELSNALHVGGSLENALTGNYKLSASSVVQEAMKLTQKNFWPFLPATLILTGANLAIFLVVLTVLQGHPDVLFDAVVGREEMTPDILASAESLSFYLLCSAHRFMLGRA